MDDRLNTNNFFFSDIYIKPGATRNCRVTESQLKNSRAFSSYTARKKIESAFLAAKIGETDSLRKIMTERDHHSLLTVDERQQHGRRSLLMEAARHGNVSTVKLLVQLGAQINATCNLGRTALMWACIMGECSTVRTLLELGSDIHKQDRWGHSALTLTADDFHSSLIDCFLLLVEWGADVKFRTPRNMTALEILAEREEAHNLLQTLLLGRFKNLFNLQERNSAMVHALYVGAKENLNIFLSSGCNPNYVTKQGVHVLNIAASTGFKCTQQLLASGAKFCMSLPHPNFVFKYQDQYRLSPVDVAILYKNFSSAKLLFQKFHIPPTYLCHYDECKNIPEFGALLSTIQKNGEENPSWCNLIKDYCYKPRPLFHLCLEVISCCLGPLDRKMKLSQCRLPKKLCDEILMENISEKDFLENKL